VNLVAAVNNTLFCAVEDCTCRVPDDTAAISPVTPGIVGAPPPAPEPWLGAWVGRAEAVGVALLVPPHAASTVTNGSRARATPM
jgi:hypothetical protein